MAVLCRACRRHDCADCIRHLYQGAGCEHMCQDERQGALFPLSQISPSARVTSPDAAAPGDLPVDW